MSETAKTELSPNRDLSVMLAKIASYYSFVNDKHRKNTYDKAAKNVRDYNEKILSGKEARENIAGIGVSIEKDINEYLSTGEMERLETLKRQHGTSFNDTVDLFLRVHGIGPVKAIQLYEKGYRTLEDLRENTAELNADVVVGLKWFEDLQFRIPRFEMDSIINNIFDLFSKDAQLKVVDWEVAGSYRRGEKSSGDLDLLVSSDSVSMNHIVDVLQPVIVGILAQGSMKMMAVIKLDGNLARRIDIRLFDKSCYPYALLHSTGSKDFNVLMRNRAIELGYKLSEYSLCDSDGKCLPAKTEEDIFMHLEVAYIPPTSRSNVSHLTVC